MLETILSNPTLLIIGVVVVLVVIYLVWKNSSANRPADRMRRDDERVWREQGSEQPRYDSDEVRSSGGIGGAPSSSRRQRDRGFDDRRRTERSRGGTRSSLGGSQPRRERRNDDDDVQSRGGFGG